MPTMNDSSSSSSEPTSEASAAAAVVPNENSNSISQKKSSTTMTTATVTSPTEQQQQPVSLESPTILMTSNQQEQQEPFLSSSTQVAHSTSASASSLTLASSDDRRSHPSGVADDGDTDPTPAYPSLAKSPTTPKIACVLVPFLCIVCHAVFYYGQTDPMWKLHVNATIDVWANATEYTARRVFDVAGLDYENHITFSEEEDVQTFTYMYAINELWRAKDLPGLVLPRMAAVLLIVFSGLWPHLKLLMLNITWFFGRHPTRRTRTLQWLSGLGKWSLADVLVVCVMVGVLHLDWVVEPDEIKQGVINDLPSILAVVKGLYSSEDLCDKLLKMECATEKRVTKIAKCKACKSLVSEAYYRPEWAKSTGRTVLDGISTNGGGVATLRVVGMNGIYAFCAAVILSILLSLVVDIFDVQAKARLKRQQSAERSRYSTLAAAASGATVSYTHFDNMNEHNNDIDDNNLDEPLLMPSNRSRTGSLEIELPGGDEGEDGNQSESNSPAPRLFSTQFVMVTVITMIVIVFAVDAFSMERLVSGAGPQLLHEVLGMDWEKMYSLRSLMWTTGASGGWDYMLMGTFGLFCVLGPILRAVLLVATVILDQCRVSSGVQFLSHAVNFIGSFCAWEVFAIAIIMVQMLMPSITSTIIKNAACATVSEDGSCLQVEFNVVPFTFLTVIFGGIFLVMVSTITTRYVTKCALLRQFGDSGSIISLSNSSSGGNRLLSSSRVMPPNHNYQRLAGIEEEEQYHHPTADADDDNGFEEELVFETNNV
eukprot:CAMPEP_0113443098 /NCGR_PEP_ID=MMETSP0014_2-20120614/1958_1 /TAXON_ID=2857 /ORGANISM="Nitzschia sp." /LENGTH=767 /DNA_ID=CAMNT_0000334033 /DNA_START=33 /DNA_END=2336 /DNA_ORIENTATION=- /assembly_acc=CAM_ASM_000159